jgi:1,4-dihydroxy-2-naphthoate octaprenyltransferase
MDNLLALVLVALMASSVFLVGISRALDFAISFVVFVCLVVAYFYFGGR